VFKNVASQKLIVFAFDATTNLPKTGDAANLTAYVSKDYGAVTVLGDTSATEMDATNAKGYYLFDLTQAETNANTLLFSAKSSTANIVVIGAPATVFTDPPNHSALGIDSSGNLTGSVASVAGAVASVTARVTANTDQLAGQTVTAAAGVTFPTSVASPTNITAGTITNLTNAPTAGDFTAVMKTSIGTAVAASAVASVTGNVGGNLVGSIGSLAAQAKADVNAEVDSALDTAIPGTPTANSINERIQTMDNAYTATRAGNLDNLDATVSSRLASASYTAPLSAAGTRTAVGLASANLDTQLSTIAGYIDTEVGTLQTTATAIKAKTDSLTFTTAGIVDANVQQINDVTITGNGQVGTEFGV
jgi:hypothetical protein